MKSLVNALVLALATGSASAGVVFSENFDSESIGAFSYEDYLTSGPSSFKWTTNGVLGLGNFTGGTGAAAMSDSDSVAGPYDHAIVSPAIDLPDGKITLNFQTNYQNFSNIDFADVDISPDDGGTWRNVLRFNEDHGHFYSVPGESALIDLSAYAGDTIRLRFHHYNTADDANDWYWQVDNVTVEASPIPAPGAIGLLGVAGLVAARRTRR